MAHRDTRGRRRGGIVPLDLLDDTLFRVASAEQGHPIQDDGDESDANGDDPDEITLPYSFAICMEMWRQYREHGTMAVAGGLLDQPRQWLRMIRYFNSRYGLAYEDAKRERKDEEYWRKLAAGAEGGIADFDDLLA